MKTFLCAAVAVMWGCAPSPEWIDAPPEQLPLGEYEIKADGQWGDATTCKAIPALQPLADPSITISVNGLTLRLVDKATGFERVYPVGVGSINDEVGSTTENLSRTLFPVLKTGSNNFTIKTGQVEPCTIWWKEPETGKTLPVFAGLPFISFYGPYGIHGPVTQYWLPSGGKLRRGYVSHGCVRMEGADVAELWAYIRGVSTVPARLQLEVERRSDGTAVDLAQSWLLSQCKQDADCDFAGGICRQNSYSGRGFCTAACDRLCNYDRFGYPISFCVADDPSETEGYCTYKASAFNNACRGYDSFAEVLGDPRFGQPSVVADVCKPGSQGWIGDRCLVNSDCEADSSCEPVTTTFGYCTQSCSLYCPDSKGRAGTFCVDGLCRARCQVGDNGASCPAGFECLEQPRYNQPAVRKTACMPAGPG